MEDYIPIHKITCKFTSNTFNYLNITLFHSHGYPIAHILMLENRKYQIEPPHPLTYCYLTALPPNCHQDYTLQISSLQGQEQSRQEKEHKFEQFTFTVQLKTKQDRVEHNVLQVNKREEDSANLTLAQACLLKVKQKVMLTLTKQNFIRNKRKSRLVLKTKLRRSKTKKNLTAIYYRNTSNEIVAKTFKKQLQKSQISLTAQQQHQKQVFTNNQITGNSKSCFGLEHCRSSQAQNTYLIEDGQKKVNEKQQEEAAGLGLSENQENQDRKEWCIRYCAGKSKSRYMKTLENETIHNLQVQKEQLQFLKTITANQATITHKPIMIRIKGAKQGKSKNRESELVLAYRKHSPSKNMYKVRLFK